MEYQIVMIFTVPGGMIVQEFRDQMQKVYYDEGGVAGRFEIIDRISVNRNEQRFLVKFIRDFILSKITAEQAA